MIFLKPEQKGFTIIEIMVAVLLLATSLVAIFGSQFAAVSSSVFARNVTWATQLGKCKMSELELVFIEEGFQLTDVNESGTCCEFLGSDFDDRFLCEWEVKTIEFPDMTSMLDGADISGITDGLVDDSIAGEIDPQQNLFEDLGMGIVGELVPTIMSLLEQAIRRVTVRVTWKEGRIEKEFELVQYVSHPTEGPLGLLQEAASFQQQLEDMGALRQITGGGDAAKGQSSGTRRQR